MTEDVPERFADSIDGTVGIEEEFAILDPATLDMVPRFEELRDAATGQLAESIAGELISSEIEIRSGRGEDLADAQTRQRDHRRALLELVTARDAALGATGTHAFADYREQPNIDTEHYRRVVDGLQYVARRNNTFSLHVHVGVNDIDRAVKVSDRLRSVLPELLAVSANSVFLDARDAGLHSARTQSFTKSFPRCGIPDAYGSWQTYKDYIDLLVRTGSIVEYTQVWWSVRPHFSFGTVEIRICDAQSTAHESDALAALCTAAVLQAARDHDEGRPFTDPPRRLLEESLWRAIRFGKDAPFVDYATGAEYEPLERLMAWTAPVRAELGIEPSFPALNGAQRQRRALDAGASLQEVYAASVQETMTTYATSEVPAG